MGGMDEPSEPDVEEPEVEGPERRCVVTGEVRSKAELLRFVLSPAGEVVPDIGSRLPGRGIWLCARRDVVNTAVAKRLFAKAARRAAVVPADLADRLEVLLARRCLDALGLARRAGQAVCGFEKVRAELKARRVAVLVEARDAAEGGSGKMRALASGLPVVDLFDAAELGPIFGRDAAVHASWLRAGSPAVCWRRRDCSPGSARDRSSSEMLFKAGFPSRRERDEAVDERSGSRA
jgi:predicted RNA-binding protein YlxR (DUF448 family)